MLADKSGLRKKSRMPKKQNKIHKDSGEAADLWALTIKNLTEKKESERAEEIRAEYYKNDIENG